MLNAVVQGEGPKKLLIAHGLFGSARNWGVIARRLSDAFEVTAVDMRNHGASPWFDSHSYPDMAADLAPFAGGAVLGHSMGGKAAMVLALTQPGRVKALIVADIAPVAYGHSQMAMIEAMRGVDLSRVDSRSDAAAQMHVEPPTRDFLLQSLDLRNRCWTLNLDVLEREMPRIVGFPEIDGVYEGPTLFLSGAESDYVRPEHRERIRTLFPAAKFARLPGTGHWLHAEKPRDFEASVRAFLGA